MSALNPALLPPSSTPPTHPPLSTLYPADANIISNIALAVLPIVISLI